MSEYRVVQDYPHSAAKVWRALTDPEIVPRWTTTGRGGRPEGFLPVAGTRFRYVGKPMPGWNGVVACEVVEVRGPNLLRYTWQGGDDDDVTMVTCTIGPSGTGTRLIFEHTGFTGFGGFIVSRILASVRKKMLAQGLPPVLEQMDD